MSDGAGRQSQVRPCRPVGGYLRERWRPLQRPHDGVKIISKLKKQADCVPEPRARKPSIDEGQCRDGGIGQVSALGGTPETPQRRNTCETYHCQ